ncbi:MAG: hypothetical protein ACXW3D_09340 [Caulobacteraceae bacterium]
MSLGVIMSLAADVMWIVAMATMAGASRSAFRTVPKGVAVPMLWNDKRIVIWRAPRTLGLTLLLGVAFVGGMALLYLARTSPTLEAQMIWFGVRAVLAPLAALAQMTHLRRALRTLGAEGRLVP